MAGGNKSNSPKAKKRKLQVDDQTRKALQEKKKRFAEARRS